MTNDLTFDPSTVDLDALLKRLHLANARRVWPALCEKAETEQWSCREFLAVLVAEEIAHRQQTRLTRAVSDAEFPFLKTIEDFNFSFQSTLRLHLLGSYLGPELFTEGRNLILMGKTGRGKTHLAIAIAYRAIQNGATAFFTTAAELIDDLSAASRAGRLRETLAKYVHPNVLVVDEVGYLTHGPDAANVLFHVVNDRHLRRRSILFTTNKSPLTAWGAVLHDHDLAEAIVDRTLERGRLLVLDGPSVRTPHLDSEAQRVNSEPDKISGKGRTKFPEPPYSVGHLNPGSPATFCEPFNLLTVFNGARCGDGAVNFPEECDDGDLASGDGCSDVCSVEECFACSGDPSACIPSGVGNACDDHDVCTAASQCQANGACTGPVTLDCDDGDICTDDPCLPSSGCDHMPTVACDDGRFCTADSCDSDLGCQHEPDVRSCRAADKSRLVIVDRADDRDKLVWKWIKGASTTQTELADPLSSATYELCLFAGSAPSLTVVGEATVGPDASKWNPIGDEGFRYNDLAGSQDGIQKLVLKASDDNESKILLRGSGTNLPDPHPPLALPLTIQLTNTDSDVCWGASYATADPNESGKLKAKTTTP